MQLFRWYTGADLVDVADKDLVLIDPGVLPEEAVQLLRTHYPGENTTSIIRLVNTTTWQYMAKHRRDGD